jgi:ubiquinol-cytochrome c reductase iron-sulfur subunit
VRGERPIIVAFVVSIVSALALTVVYTVGGQTQLEGLFLGLALAGLGSGVVLWAKRFMPTDEASEDRGRLESTEEEVAAFTRDFERGSETLQRRNLLVKLGLGAVGALGLAALFPIRSLGPRPGRGLKTTEYANGPTRVVTEDGTPVRAVDVAPGGVLTVFPEGHVQDADTPTLLINTGTVGFNPRPGRQDWTVAGVVAYSKLCTHTGCPVGLYQSEEQLLLCPCHQSTFDVLDGARPVFGPAARSLPQLPIATDDEGYIIATGDFSDPVGGGFWDRGT